MSTSTVTTTKTKTLNPPRAARLLSDQQGFHAGTSGWVVALRRLSDGTVQGLWQPGTWTFGAHWIDAGWLSPVR